MRILGTLMFAACTLLGCKAANSDSCGGECAETQVCAADGHCVEVADPPAADAGAEPDGSGHASGHQGRDEVDGSGGAGGGPGDAAAAGGAGGGHVSVDAGTDAAGGDGGHVEPQADAGADDGAAPDAGELPCVPPMFDGTVVVLEPEEHEVLRHRSGAPEIHFPAGEVLVFRWGVTGDGLRFSLRDPGLTTSIDAETGVVRLASQLGDAGGTIVADVVAVGDCGESGAAAVLRAQ